MNSMTQMKLLLVNQKIESSNYQDYIAKDKIKDH